MYFTPSIGTDGLQAGHNRLAHFWFASIETAKDASVLSRTGLCDQISQIAQREKARNLVRKLLDVGCPRPSRSSAAPLEFLSFCDLLNSSTASFVALGPQCVLHRFRNLFQVWRLGLFLLGRVVCRANCFLYL
jgi:hypothetical protein